MKTEKSKYYSRGISENPAGRFEKYSVERDQQWLDEEEAPKTQYITDRSRTIITYNSSPDVGFDASINPYRGCEHGCAYCYARPTHEYFGYSIGTDFESKILVKENAPHLLRKELASPKWKPQPLAISGVTDPYQPIERRLKITRECLEILVQFRNPVVVVTKNHLVTRDVDLLQQLAVYNTVKVYLSITTLNKELSRKMEPRTSIPARRLEAIETLAKSGIPTGVLVAPIIPALTDHEIFSIIKNAENAAAGFASYIVLRLPFGLKSFFEKWLEKHYPDQKNKVLNRVKEMRGGALYDSQFDKRMIGEGIYSEQISKFFKTACRKVGLEHKDSSLSTKNFLRPGQTNLSFE
jgi:DNA repair photolyase